jgi:hypothetical protein
MLVIGLAVCGVGLVVPGGNLAASELIVTGEEADSGTLLVPVKQIAGGQDYEGELEISRDGIAYISAYTGAWKFTPWKRMLRWRCFGSKDVAPNEEALCTLMMRIETEAPPATPHATEYLCFKVPCEMVAGQENWKTMQQYDPWGHF